MRRRPAPWCRGLLAGSLVVLLGGCAGYQMGPTAGQTAGGRSLRINPVQNTTLEPRLGPAVSQALRKQVQRDGTLRLESWGDPDIVLQTEILRYRREELAYKSSDTLTASDYEITIFAKVVALERATGRELLNREIRGRTTLFVGNDMVSAERQALPLLAEDLARNITVALVEGEW